MFEGRLGAVDERLIAEGRLRRLTSTRRRAARPIRPQPTSAPRPDQDPALLADLLQHRSGTNGPRQSLRRLPPVEVAGLKGRRVTGTPAASRCSYGPQTIRFVLGHTGASSPPWGAVRRKQSRRKKDLRRTVRAILLIVACCAGFAPGLIPDAHPLPRPQSACPDQRQSRRPPPHAQISFRGIAPARSGAIPVTSSRSPGPPGQAEAALRRPRPEALVPTKASRPVRPCPSRPASTSSVADTGRSA